MKKLLIGTFSNNHDVSMSLATSLVAIVGQAVDVEVSTALIANSNSDLGSLATLLDSFVASESEYFLLLDKEVGITPQTVFAAIALYTKANPTNFDIIAFPILDGDLSGQSSPIMSAPIGAPVDDLVQVEVASLSAMMISKNAANKLISKFESEGGNVASVFGLGTNIDTNTAFFSAAKLAGLTVGMKVNSETTISYRRSFAYGSEPTQA